MKFGHLSGKHPDYDHELWERYEALYRGGKDFRKRIGRFLTQNPTEPPQVYEQRKKDAHYRSYVGPIVDFFAAQLMAAPMTVLATNGEDDETVEADDFYARFKEDVDGVGTDLVDFARASFRSTLVKGSAWWLASLPSDDGQPPASRADWEERELGRVKLHHVEADSVIDWECDDEGGLLWACLHECTTPRRSFEQKRGLKQLTFRVFDRETVTTYQKVYDPETEQPDAETEIPMVSRVPHGFSRVPLVRIELPEGLWLLNRAADAQIEHFRLSSGLGWAIRRSCYAMPVFKMGNDGDGKPTAPMGVGYYLVIGQNDDMTWAAPPSEPFDVIATEIKAQKDEIYRVAQQMAQGVENNAAAIGRSGESKMADSSATEVCLKAYGSVMREAIEKAFDLVVDGRKDSSVKFSVQGLDRFNLADAAIAVDNAAKAGPLNIPSPTFKKELFVTTAEALLPSLEQEKKDAIRQEIEQGVDAAEKAAKEAEAQAARTGEAAATMAENAAANGESKIPAPGTPAPN